MALKGVNTTKARDWKIAFVGMNGFSIAFGYNYLTFVIASERAQVMMPLFFGGVSLGLGLSFGGAKGKAWDLAEKKDQLIKEFKSPKQKVFWPLKIFQPFSVYDVDYGPGTAGVYTITTDRVLRFHADRKGAILNQAGARLFEHPSLGLPMNNQGLGLVGGKWIDGTWRYNGSASYCWDLKKCY